MAAKPTFIWQWAIVRGQWAVKTINGNPSTWIFDQSVIKCASPEIFRYYTFGRHLETKNRYVEYDAMLYYEPSW